jgi:hypothetical protein
LCVGVPRDYAAPATSRSACRTARASPPLHLPLGARAYALARTKIAEFTQDIDAWEEVAKATDYV